MNNIIENKGISLCDFINNIEILKEGHDTYHIEKIVNKENISKDEEFFKWTTYSHDEENSFCPEGCHYCCCLNPEDKDYDCEKISLKYYVEQWTTNMEGDSYSGNLVYPLEDYYVFVSYNC